MITDFLNSLEPDPAALFREISKHVTDEMLSVIAAEDYGENVEEHFAALRLLRDTSEFREPMHWYPCEVLELVRNAPPGMLDKGLGSSPIASYWMLAFASSALLRAVDPPWKYGADAAGSCYNLIQLITSLQGLPAELTRQAVRMVAWKMLQWDLEGSDAEVVAFGVGLLWLALQLNPPPPDHDLVNLAEWIVRREEEITRLPRGTFDRWLLGIIGVPPPSEWEDLGRDFLVLDLSSHQKQLQEWVMLIGSELAGPESG
jgi:hypothetical protein